MNVYLLKSKLHHARVTGINMDYEGSIVIDAVLMEEVDLCAYEKVLVANMSTGARFETYVIPGPPGSGRIDLNGATARLGQVGDRLIVFAFAQVTRSEAGSFTPKIVQLDEKNRVLQRLSPK
ncbi:MAG: aspartate 1-decarboxylase [Candidatus Latescibacteria bacterium]|nr:aspartate 1-decarboxylase [Candidatus Latescibacterota bacterium]NIM22063.1 aspartate 1-decarboxylase [Candidatus Latescibacterota bacterium]NIM66082.1 aspartate 1-decarboxylase [Candidatus Latescibacterota bacterium]NIO02490.1 aspartate 1-decarboxylase [Candidatus Latescibacterota bacterium]NIO29401.1 aspartate 1-decarboxylase [Candidatus Latescibacterota bacterium]